ncbi:serine hydrolase [Lactiplantibacillus garii]|uniref:Serine hydrolase n=1 Tax=Lactiplantibacillus garii TaxID=2306423 RepID=A0A3R8KF67_9LACO|nr:serine hydrolase [Lactiplantibacillus garii]
MYCKFCGTKNSPDAAFCKNCGQPMTRTRANAAGQKTTPPRAEAGEQPQISRSQSQPSGQRYTTGTGKQRKRGPWWFIIGALILILAIGGFIYFQNGQSEQGHSAKTSSSVVKRNHQNADQASSASTKTASTHTKTVFPTTAVQRDVDKALTGMGGTTSVAVLPVTGSGQVVNNNQSQRAASLIKLFILVTVYQRATDQELSLDDSYSLQSSDKVGGTGTLQNLPNGSKLTYREITKRMIDESDNTAANIMIAAVGGMGNVNAEIKSLRLTDTKLERHLMDTAALKSGKDNYTSVKDVAKVLQRLYNHRLVSERADTQMLSVLKNNANHAKLPKNLPSDAVVYNKTGEYNAYGVQNDAAIIKNSRGAFIAVVLSQDGKEASQVTAMNQLGAALYQTLLTK